MAEMMEGANIYVVTYLFDLVCAILVSFRTINANVILEFSLGVQIFLIVQSNPTHILSDIAHCSF